MRKMTKRLLKWTVITFAILIVLFTAATYSLHRYKLSVEQELLQEASQQGELVFVDGKQMHVYEEGAGEDNYVFMAGSGVVAPEYELKGLYRLFSKDNRIAVVNRAGYGLSDVYNGGRDIDLIVDQTREALQKSGNKPPYVLIPHSISGMEAIYWAQKYPEEIKAIVALDIGLPKQYVENALSSTDKLMIHGMNIAVELGYHRLVPEQVFHPEVIKQGFLTDKEKEIYKTISFKQQMNRNVRDELIYEEANAKKSITLPAPKETPILLIAAYTKENKYIDYKLESYQSFVDQLNNGEVVKIAGKHSIYLYAADEIYKTASSFIEEINDEEKGVVK